MRGALSILHVLLALALSPLLLGIINRTKAAFGGRRGPPLLQPYYDLAKLFGKGATYSRTTTWLFRAGPLLSLACALSALLIVPLGGIGGLVAFPGDLVLFAYLFGLMRFVMVLAALDTGSAFEGMGASREVQFAMLAEPALLIGLGALAANSRSLSLSGLYAAPLAAAPACLPALWLLAGAFLVVLLAENARIPVDDPTTHLELTMIHEVMLLDHSGVDLALAEYAAAVKLWVLGALVVGVALPWRSVTAAGDLALGLAGLLALAVAVGIIESIMARLRLVRVPQLLVTAAVLSILAAAWVLR
ncbi:MAG: hydrogenase [Lentisphaerae bacterium]|nr:hydrogenase [Lentisphaerota bacterium]